MEQKKVDKHSFVHLPGSISFYASYEDTKVRLGGRGAKNPNP